MTNLTDTQYAEVLRLCACTTDFIGFEFEGLIIRGNMPYVIKKYVSKNPSKKLRTWLIDEGYVLKEI